MPILAREPDLYPGDLFDHPELGSETDRSWWVIHTKPRQEKVSARRLQRLDVWCYLPQVTRRFRSPRGRKRESFVPLFPSYVFLYGSADQRLKALESGTSMQALPVTEGIQLTRDLHQIWSLTRTGVPLIPEDRLNPGQTVRVKSGPFLNFEGRIFKRHSCTRLLVIVNYLQQGASVELDDCDVEAV